MLDLDRDLRATITAHLNGGTADTELLVQVQAAIEKLRTERAVRADAASMRQRLRYHLFIDPRGQRYRVGVNDLAAFCSEHRLSVEKMTELSNGGRGGLAEYKQWRRGTGQNSMLNGSPYMSLPELPEDDEEPMSTERRMFKPRPVAVAYNHRPTVSYIPPNERINHLDH